MAAEEHRGSRPKPRTWTVELQEVRTEDGRRELVWDRNAAADAYLECETIQHRLGGAIIIVPDRAQMRDGTFATERLIFKWESYVPARQVEEEPPEPQPEPGVDVESAVEEPEPVA